MRTFLPILFLSLSTTIFAQLNNQSIDVGQETRTYVEYIPQNYSNSESSPLVIILHGIGGYAVNYATYGLNPIADTARFIPVYLQGKQNGFGQTAWNNGTLLASTANDLGFIETIIETMVTNYNIDRSRVYIAGISMGAIMTYKVLHHLSDKIAAAVCHIGTMSTEELANFNPSLPRPLLQIHGVNDAIVPYSGTALPSLGLVPPTLSKLKSTNNWNGDSTITIIPDVVNDSITIEKIVYDCSTPLEHWKMSGLGADHVFLFEPVNDTSSMEVTWHFFRRFSHPSPTLSDQENSEVNNTNYQIYPNPTSGILNIVHTNDIQTIRIFNLNQQLVLETTLTKGVDVTHLPSGLYFIQIIDNNDQSNIQLLNKI